MSRYSKLSAADTRSKSVLDKNDKNDKSDKIDKAQQQESDHHIPFVTKVNTVSTNSKGATYSPSPQKPKHHNVLTIVPANESLSTTDENEGESHLHKDMEKVDDTEEVCNDDQDLAEETLFSLNANPPTQMSEMGLDIMKTNSYVWQDMDKQFETSQQMFQLMEANSSHEILTLMKLPMFTPLNSKLDLTVDERSELLKDHCQCMLEMFEAYVSNEDNVIIASVIGIKEQIEEGNALIDDAELSSTIDHQIQAYVIAERKIKTLIKTVLLQIFSVFQSKVKSTIGWHRFQNSSSTTLSSLGGSTAVKSVSGDPKIQFSSLSTDTTAISFQDALPQPPLNFSPQNAIINATCVNQLGDQVGKVYNVQLLKAATKLILALPHMTQDELMKETGIFFLATVTKECAGLTSEDGLVGKLIHCLRREQIPLQDQSKSGIYDARNPSQSVSIQIKELKDAWLAISDNFPHTNRVIGFEALPDQTYLYIDQEIYLKLLKRTVYQRFIFGLLLQAASTIQSYSGTKNDLHKDDKMHQDELTRLQFILLQYKPPHSRAQAINQTNGPVVESNIGANLIIHKFFAGLSCATDLLNEFHFTLSSQKGEFYAHHLSLFHKTISDILVANLSIPTKRLYMLAAAQALDNIVVVNGGDPKLFGQATYIENGIEKHAMGAPDVLARFLLCQISTQLQFRSEIPQALKQLVIESEITNLANIGSPYDGSASTYLDVLISKLEYSKVDSTIPVDATGVKPLVLWPYPHVTSYTDQCPDLYQSDYHTNLYAAADWNTKSMSAAKPSKLKKSSTVPKPTTTTTKATPLANENSVTAGYQAGVQLAIQYLQAANGNALTMASEFAKSVEEKMPGTFTAQPTAKNPNGLLHPLTLLIPNANWNSPRAAKGFIKPIDFGHFIVLRELLGFQNKPKKDRVLPPELINIIATLKAASISKNVTN